jgi:hypothetical protein
MVDGTKWFGNRVLPDGTLPSVLSTQRDSEQKS